MECAFVVCDFVLAGAELDDALYYAADVAKGSAYFFVGKLVADECIKSHTAGAEEYVFVGGAVVDGADIALTNYVDCLGGVERYIEVACQSVARPEGYDSQDGVGADKFFCYFVDGAVAAGGDYEFVAFCHCFARYLGGVTCITCDADEYVIFLLVERCCELFGQKSLGLGA